jgi:hypothetical protein
VKLHIIYTPPHLPLPKGGAAGGGVHSLLLHLEIVLLNNFGGVVSRPLEKSFLSTIGNFFNIYLAYCCVIVRLILSSPVNQ